MQMDLDAASGQRTGIAPKLTLSQRLMGLDGKGGFRVDNPQVQQRPLNSFSPSSTVPGRLELTGNPWLGASQSPFALSQQAPPSPGSGNNAIVNMTAQTRDHSGIPRPAAVPKVNPNLRISDPRRHLTASGGQTRGTLQSQPPQGQQQPQRERLTQAEREAVAGVAYSETTGGTVAEHEAIISVILNRVQSGQRQYVNHGQHVNVHNVVHANTRGVPQFQGVGRRNERNFAHSNDAGAQSARNAAANITQTGPTNHATAFIVTRGGEPTQRQEQNLGNVHRVDRVGNVFLYEPGPAPTSTVPRPAKTQRPQPPRQPSSEVPR